VEQIYNILYFKFQINPLRVMSGGGKIKLISGTEKNQKHYKNQRFSVFGDVFFLHIQLKKRKMIYEI